MNLSGVPWIAADIVRLKKLWAEGISTSKMALELGRGKNSVISKVHRLNLPIRLTRCSPSQAKQNGGKAKSRTRVKVKDKRVRPSGFARYIAKHGKPPERKARPVQAPIGEPVSLNLSLTALEPGQCKYPYGDGPYVFCGHPAKEGLFYCKFHDRLCYQPPDKSRQRSTFRFYARAA